MLNSYHRIIASIFAVFIAVGITSTASAKCATRNVEQAGGSTASFTVVVPDAKLQDVVALGYQETGCANIDKETFRSQVCAPEKIGNSGMRRQIEVASGISFDDLCKLAMDEAGLTPVTAGQSAQTRPGQFRKDSRRPLQPGETPGAVGALTQLPKLGAGRP